MIRLSLHQFQLSRGVYCCQLWAASSKIQKFWQSQHEEKEKAKREWMEMATEEIGQGKIESYTGMNLGRKAQN